MRQQIRDLYARIRCSMLIRGRHFLHPRERFAMGMRIMPFGSPPPYNDSFVRTRSL